MNECRVTKESASHPWKRLTVAVLLITALLAFALFVIFRILLTTPSTAKYISHTLSRYTNHKVTVAGLSVTGGTIHLNGIRIESPPDFRNREMLSARSIALTPDVTGLAQGKRSLSRLEIVGLSVTAEKNSTGGWNLSSLLQQFMKKKEQPSAEIFIRRLSLRDVSLKMNGHTLDKLGLTLSDFSTKGTTESKLDFTGKDSAGNPLRVTAEGRVGNNPALHATIDAPAVSLAPLQQYLPGTSPLHLANAQGKLKLSAELRNRLVTIRATAAVKQLTFADSGESQPIAGNLRFEARYDTSADSAELSHSVITVDNLLTVKASGSMQQVTKDRLFTLQLTPDKIDLGSLSSLVPGLGRKGITLSGEISSRGLHLQGNRTAGITAAGGDLYLRKVVIFREKLLILDGGAADSFLKKTAKGWLLDGRIFSKGQRHNSPLIESITTPFSAAATARFKPISAQVPTVKAILMGRPVRGSFHYRAAAPTPFTLTCSATDIPLTALNRLLPEKASANRLSSGKFSLTAGLSGSALQNFKGTATLDLRAASGTLSKKIFTLEKMTVRSKLSRRNAHFSAGGSVAASGGKFDGKPFGAATDFTLADQELTLRKTLFHSNADRIHADKITGTLPPRRAGKATGQLPLLATLTGAKVSRGDLSISGISGHINARYGTATRERTLAGKADFSVRTLTYRNQSLASGTGLLTFDGRNARADVKGYSFGGALFARMQTEIFSKTRGISFSARLQKQKLEQLAGLLPRKTTPYISAGTADILLNGTYLQQTGIEGSLAVTGHDITLEDSTGKTLTSGISANFDALVRGHNLTLKEGLLRHSGGPSLRVEGKVERFAFADRKGTLSFSMPSTTINSLLDAFANALPRSLQEASCEGSCSLSGSAELLGTSGRLNGNLALAAASVEIPSQKIAVTGIEGTIPFSLKFPRQKTVPEPAPLKYNRENYPKLLEALSRPNGSGSRITIGTSRYGALETGKITLLLTATDGIMRISPMVASLYDGTLTGNGYLILKDTPEYGANILLRDVSLKHLCDSFPSIQGYITGRVDGIVSLKNVKGGLKQLTGYVNLWTRSGKGEKMMVSKEFLQKLAGKKLRGFFFQNDRPYDNGEISAFLLNNYLTFEKLDISHTNFLGMKDLSVSVVAVQNRISLDHLLESIRNAAARGKGGDQGAPPIQTDLKWLE
jgi:hypothetical protein